MIGRRIEFNNPASPPDRNAPFATPLVNQLALPDSPQSFGGEHPRIRQASRKFAEPFDCNCARKFMHLTSGGVWQCGAVSQTAHCPSMKTILRRMQRTMLACHSKGARWVPESPSDRAYSE